MAVTNKKCFCLNYDFACFHFLHPSFYFPNYLEVEPDAFVSVSLQEAVEESGGDMEEGGGDATYVPETEADPSDDDDDDDDDPSPDWEAENPQADSQPKVYCIIYVISVPLRG